MIVSLLFIFHVSDLISAAAARLGSREISLTGPAEEYRLADDFSFPLGHSRVNANESPTYTVRATPTTVWRPRDLSAIQRAREWSLRHAQSEPVEWEQVDVLGPDVEDIHTLAQLARMTGNAYALPGQKNWYDVDPSWNISFPFGWEDSDDGFRGHVFMSPDNSTVVLSIKGTTVMGTTSKKDKLNDNLLFSCCCARVDLSWVFRTVCDCYSNHWRCDDTCLSDALIKDSLFYNIGVGLIANITAAYPNSTIWLTGHSLGGALASLLGTTFGLPAVAFEAPGERLAAQRLHLPVPPPDPSCTNTSTPHTPVTHVYHNADPVPQGACTGFGSACASAGYALETRCHLGKSIVFDTVNKLGWRVDVRKHPIRNIILEVLEHEFDVWDGWVVDEWGNVRDVPEAVPEDECVDCYKWEFGEFKKKKLDGTS